MVGSGLGRLIRRNLHHAYQRNRESDDCGYDGNPRSEPPWAHLLCDVPLLSAGIDASNANERCR